jgi:hypothetical protein
VLVGRRHQNGDEQAWKSAAGGCRCRLDAMSPAKPPRAGAPENVLVPERGGVPEPLSILGRFELCELAHVDTVTSEKPDQFTETNGGNAFRRQMQENLIASTIDT